MPLINYPHIASMAFNTPVYATQDVMQTVAAFLEPRITGKAPDTAMDVEDSMPPGTPGQVLSVDDRDSYGINTQSKIASIPVHGILVPRRGTIDANCSELKSYEKLRNQVRLAVEDETVKEIVLDFHTGGGAAMGCKETADFIHQAQKEKPITAIVNFAAYSAGYFLAAACTRIICSPTAGVGSIGVRMETVDFSKLEENIGVTFTTHYRGGHKNDMSPHEPLTEGAQAEIDKSLDLAYQCFTESVATYRGLDLQVVIDTEARCYEPEEALKLGLIDEIMPAQEAVNQLAKTYAAPPRKTYQAQAAALSMKASL